MGSADNQTFKVNFTGHGVAKLRERVKEKLNEFMGDYTDDTLVEYVIVLLRNGRRKEEARDELNVFLGDESDSFIAWLWDHLASSLHLYVEHHEVHDEVTKIKTVSGEKTRIINPDNLDAESEKASRDNSTRRHHNKQRKDSAKEKARQEVHCQESSSSPLCPVKRKRNRSDDLHNIKKEIVPQVPTGAPRRLLQFAVRDAVATSKPSNMTTPGEPASKRLRSVVATVSGELSPVGHPQQIPSIASVQNPLTTAINAVAEADEDVKRFKYSCSVFDRLGRPMDSIQSDEELEESNQKQEQVHPKHFQGVYSDMITVENQADDEGFDDMHVLDHDRTGASKDEELLMAQYDVDKDNNIMLLQQSRNISQQAMAAKDSHKIWHVAPKINSWKQPYYQESREIARTDVHNSLKNCRVGHIGSSLQTVKRDSAVEIMNKNAKPAADTKKELPKTQPSNNVVFPAGGPLEDADSRTIFVSNVHFAATKDSLSRHFSKFGEVLKVIILTNAATGLPKGASYVEFTRKDTADNALSLDGTSFMSRIIKVVKKSAAPQESSEITAWPRLARASPYSAGLGRVPFTRGSPNAHRPWSPCKPVARSLQWRRDAQSVAAENAAAVSASSNPTPVTRSLKYVRTEVKQDSQITQELV